MRGTGRGWVTAEYSLLPGSSPERISREAARGRQTGRTQEIQRLIGRSLRAVCDLAALGERQVVLDCDVLQADGGTRTAAVCGAYLALHDACSRLRTAGLIAVHPLREHLAAVSVGNRRRRGDARSRLLGGLPGPSGHERRHDELGPLRRGAGDGGGAAVQPRSSSTSCSAMAEGRDPSGAPARGGGRRCRAGAALAGVSRALRPGDGEPGQGRRDQERALGGAARGGVVAPARGGARGGRDGRHPRRERPHQGDGARDGDRRGGGRR